MDGTKLVGAVLLRDDDMGEWDVGQKGGPSSQSLAIPGQAGQTGMAASVEANDMTQGQPFDVAVLVHYGLI